MRRSVIIFISLLGVVFSSGCFWPLIAEMAQDPMGRVASLNLAQRKYTNAVRWGDIEEAVQLVHPEMQAEFLSYEGEFHGIRVTDFDVGQLIYGEHQQTATVRVTYHAYSLASMLEREIKEVQKWERLSARNDWVVRPQLAGLLKQVIDIQ